MGFDGLFIHSLLIELNQTLVNGHISKITQPFASGFVFTIRSNRKNYNLFLNSSNQNAYFGITNKNFQNPLTAPNLLMTFRRYLLNGKLINILQNENDRIVNFQISNTNEFGDAVIYNLFFEILGSKTNIILVNSEKKIIDLLKKIPLYENRPMLPGLEYQIPQNDKLNPFNAELSQPVSAYQGFNKVSQSAVNNNLKTFINNFNYPKPTYSIKKNDFFAWNYFKENDAEIKK
ncbi:MAG: NFACT family protein, partial [Lactobacillaceae bacterium]|nr:NFACT family protein [Lactobacillaceae bacterium]